MKKQTPRQKLEELAVLNEKNGFYGLYNQFVILIETQLYNKATKIMCDLNPGILWGNPRAIHNQIYNDLLDNIPVKDIKKKFKIQ